MEKIPNAVLWEQIASFKDSIPKVFAQKIDFEKKKFLRNYLAPLYAIYSDICID